jgi:hypothetical protein
VSGVDCSAEKYSFGDNTLAQITYIEIEGNTERRLSGLKMTHTSAQGRTGHEMPQMLCGEHGGVAILP